METHMAGAITGQHAGGGTTEIAITVSFFPLVLGIFSSGCLRVFRLFKLPPIISIPGYTFESACIWYLMPHLSCHNHQHTEIM